MKSLGENLAQYAGYHRDRRNIATHFAGVPMIVFAVVLALATVALPLGSFTITLAAAVSVAASIYYFRLDFAFGLTMALALFVMCAAASELTARLSIGATLAWAGAIFTAGWALQLLGHKYEGLKPAFVDDAKQLLIGPLFVCAEIYFLLGERAALRRYIEERAGPTVARRTSQTGHTPLVPPAGTSGLSPVFGSFREFYPFYLGEHRNATCRKLHFAGSTLVLALLAFAVVTRTWWMLWLLPVAGYGFAWVGHYGFEKNRPATFKHPALSFAGDWVMYWQLLTGKLSFEDRDPRARQGADSA